MAIDGNWNLSMQTPMGTREVQLALTASGSDLSGNFSSPQGSSDVKGTVDGSAVTFSTTFTGAMGPMELKFAGTESGDEIAGTVQFGAFGSGPFTAKRA